MPVVIAMFTLAVIYAAFCATSCAFEARPEFLQHSPSNSDASSRPEDSHHDDSGDCVCAASEHLDAFIPADAGIAQFAFAKIGHIHAAAASVQHLEIVLTPSGFHASDLAPPNSLNGTLRLQSSVFRI